MWVTSFKTHCLVFFVCLFWKVGCVSTGVVTVFVFFPSVLPVIRTVLILFLQLTRGSLKRINQYPLLIPHTAASYLKPCPCYFFFFILSSRNWPRTMTHPPVKCSLCCCFVVSLRQSSFPFFLTLLPYPEQTAFLMKHGWKQNFASSLVSWPTATFLFLLILPTKVLIQCAVILEWLLPHHFCCLTLLLLLVQVLEKGLHCHRLELQVHDLKQHIKQMVKLTALQDQENKRMQK